MFRYLALRDHIEINNTPLRCVFIDTLKDLTTTDNTSLLQDEVVGISRITAVGRYATNQITLIKSLSFEPITVQATTPQRFNTILVLAGSAVIGKYQWDSRIQVSPDNPAVIQLGRIDIDFT